MPSTVSGGIDWAFVCETIRSTFEPLIGLDVQWRDQKSSFVRPVDGVLNGAGACKLHSEILNELGWSDFRKRFNAGTDVLDIIQTGYVKFVVSVLVETYDPTDPRTALAYLSALEVALNRPQIIEKLIAANLSVVGFSDTRDHATIYDQRVVSSASADLQFLGVFTQLADGDGIAEGLAPLAYIKTVGAAVYNGEDPDAPYVSGSTPSTAPAAGGTVLVVTGRGFTDATACDVDGVACGAFAVIDDLTIHCTSPVHSAGGPFSINVTTPEHGENRPNRLFIFT